jgi:hypothetical protein
VSAIAMNHYCTYFDREFLPQGLALWRSMQAHDPAAVLWVLALDDFTADVLRRLGEPGLRVVPLAELEAGEPALAAAKTNRTRVEYYFTLSPCCSHRFAPFLRHYEQHGRYNVGVLAWRRDRGGLACLDWWRERCLEWCHDRLEPGRYADQKYLEEWPRLFTGVVECRHPGVNLAPWNWMNHRLGFALSGAVTVDNRPLVVFHFARFRALRSDRWWQSGQLDYGVMPSRMRNALYGAYWRALAAAAVEIRRVAPDWRSAPRTFRFNRAFWRELPLRVVFGSDWLRVGDRFVSGRLGVGRYSGRVLARLRTILLRK